MSATLNGHAATAALLTIPATGLWYASVDLADAIALEGAVTLVVLNQTWQGFVIAGAVADGRARYRVVAGAGGWGSDLPSRAYANDAGLQISKLVADVAQEAGELAPVDAPTTRLGPHFVRPAAPASFLLNLLAPRAWYAAASGAVTFTERQPLAAPDAPTIARNPAARMIEIALTDSATNVVPGASTEFGTASDVEI